MVSNQHITCCGSAHTRHRRARPWRQWRCPEPADHARSLRSVADVQAGDASTSTIRRNPSAPSSRLKTLSYIDKSRRPAKQRGGMGGCSADAQHGRPCRLLDHCQPVPAEGQHAHHPGPAIRAFSRRHAPALIAAAPHLKLAVEEREGRSRRDILRGCCLPHHNSLRFIRPVRCSRPAARAGADVSRLTDALCEAARHAMRPRSAGFDLNESAV